MPINLYISTSINNPLINIHLGIFIYFTGIQYIYNIITTLNIIINMTIIPQ